MIFTLQCFCVTKLRHYITKDVLSMLYYGLVYSKLQYGIFVWGAAAVKYLSEIQVNMNKILRAITNSSRYSPLAPLYKKLNFLKLTKIFHLELAKFTHQLLNMKLSTLFQDFTKNKRAKAVINILFKKRRFD